MGSRQQRCGIYLRAGQGSDATGQQRLSLERIAARRGWRVVEIYLEHGANAPGGRRPALSRMRRDALRGRLDVVAVWSVDRLGRSVAQVVTLLHELTERKVAVYLHQQQVDGTTAAGKALLAMCAVFSEAEWPTASNRPAARALPAKLTARGGKPTGITAKPRPRRV